MYAETNNGLNGKVVSLASDCSNAFRIMKATLASSSSRASSPGGLGAAGDAAALPVAPSY